MRLQLLVQRVLKQPAARVLLASVFLYLVAFQYCRLRFWRDPHSAFFDSRTVYDWKYSLFREHQAKHFISVYNAPSDPPPATVGDSHPLLCAAVTTVKRDTDDYFDAAVGSLLEDLDPRERRALHLNVLFADTDPSRHPSWEQRWVGRLADSAGSYNVSDETMEHLKELEGKRNFYEKGVFDYNYMLEDCLATNAPYIAIFEDDIILADGWLIKTLNGLTEITRKSPQNADWLYLRLFYTETSLSWTSSDFWYRNMPLAFALVITAGLAALLTIRRYHPGARASYLDYPSIAVICFITLPAFTGLVYMMGKYNIQPLQGVVEMNAYGCCTQGLVFPREQVPGLMSYLHKRGAGQTDSMIEEYAGETGLTRYALAPQQMQHVGLRSSRDNTALNTQSTWAFWFEESDPRVLAKEHEKLLREGSLV